MEVDARTLPDHARIETDVCIVGAGAAGITLAREFGGQPFRVCLLESGGPRADHATQALYQGELSGHPGFPLDETRATGFGGSTSQWHGSCRPLDDVDFQVRDWVPFSGWPFPRSHLEPFYVRAQAVCQIGPFTYDARDWADATSPSLPLRPGRVDTHIVQISRPARFGTIYRSAIRHAPNITTLFYGSAVSLETTDDARLATHLRVATLQGKGFTIAARVFILAAGGIETPRLLLLSRTRRPTGLGNDHDLVGRFFMDHLRLEFGELRLADPARYSRLYSVHHARRLGRRTKIEGFLAIGDGLAAQEGLVRCAVQIPPRWRARPEFHSEGTMALEQLVRAIGRGATPYKWDKRLRTVLAHLDDVAVTAFWRLVEALDAKKRLVTTTYVEQIPNPDSRVTLAATRDALGRPRVRLDWRLSAIELRTIRRANEILADELRMAGAGTLALPRGDNGRYPPQSLRGGYHHMGTTRMHPDPAQGVVDAACRLHGVANVFVAGSATFPTGGYAHPTLTIVALALRLADHVRAQMAAT